MTNEARLFALDRQAAGTDIDVESLGLVAILVELIAHHGDGDRQRADNQIEDVAASHGAPSDNSNREGG